MSGGDPFVILGAGHCGGRAAEWLRRLGHDGPLVLIGSEPEAPYERPPLSKGLITGDTSFADCRLHDAAYYREQGIDLMTGRRAAAIDPAAKRVSLEGGERLSYAKLLLATGATPRRLPLPGQDLAGIHVLRDRADSEAIRQALGPGARLAVIGGGFIGLEVAASARRLGAEVVVLEAADRLLSRSLPPEVGAAVAALHQARGVEVRLGAAITGFAGANGVEAVVLADGERIEATAVVVGIGIRPDTALAEAAGLACEDGVLAGPDCRTPAPGLFVAGDAAKAYNSRYGRRMRLESWQNAEQQAEIAARAMLGLEADWSSVPWVWSDQFDWNLQAAGLPGEGSVVVCRGGPQDGKMIAFALEDGALLGAAAVGEGMGAAKDLRVAQMLIERGARPQAEALADPDTNLKALLKAA